MIFPRLRTAARSLLFGGLLTLGIPLVEAGKSPIEGSQQNLKLVQKAMELILQNFHKENVDSQQLLYGAVKGMLKELDDPFSRFMEPAKYKEMEVDTQGEFGGLGIVISVRDEILTVISPIEDTPAYQMGIFAGDQIVKIDGKSTEGMSTEDAVKILRGPVATQVTIAIMRDGFKEPKDFVLTRAIIKVRSVKAKLHKTAAGNIGYVRLTQFIKSSAQEIELALNALEKERCIGLVLDLRNNPGGLLNAAVDVSRKFLSTGTVVAIRGRDSEPIVYSSFYQSHPNTPLIVLINGGSASASEIVAGAIRDNKRGILLGEKTFGKGSVQTVMQLPDNTAMALTTALYYLPNGETIHKVGIAPDIEVKMAKLTDEQTKKILEDQAKKEKEEFKKINDKIQKEQDSKKEGANGATSTTNVTPPPTNGAKNGGVEAEAEIKTINVEPLEIPDYDLQLLRAMDILHSNHVFGAYGTEVKKGGASAPSVASGTDGAPKKN